MSWTLFTMPLAEAAADPASWEWFSSLDLARFPTEPPEAGPVLRVRDVIAALAAVHLPGSLRAVVGVDTPFTLRHADPQLPGEGWWLGEVGIQVAGRGYGDLLEQDDAVELVSFRKPDPGSVLRAACALAAAAPVIVFDADFTGVVIRPGEEPDDIDPDWPRTW